MIITRTPFRISFFGGGTDFPDFFREHGGSVLSTTINHYCYMTCRILPPFFDYNYSLRYSVVEKCRDVDDIKHNTVRECIKDLSFSSGLEVSHSGDIPANSGIGSSSSFCVGFLNSLYGLLSRRRTKRQIAQQAIHIERNRVGERVGLQDQIVASFGGFNRIDFFDEDQFLVTPVIANPEKIRQIESELILIYSGIWRVSSDIIKCIIEDKKETVEARKEMKAMVDAAMDILYESDDMHDFGRLLHEGWKLKKCMGSKISNPDLDDIYNHALNCGALGGKICGAGGGGFFLFYVPQDKREYFLKKFSHYLHVPFRFEKYGSQVVFFTANEPYLDEEG